MCKNLEIILLFIALVQTGRELLRIVISNQVNAFTSSK